MKDLVKRYVEIWNSQEVKRLSDVFSETAGYRDGMQSGNAIDVLTNSMKSTFEAFPDVSFQVIFYLEDKQLDNHCVVEWMMKGTNTGFFFGTAPTNKKIEIGGMDLIEIKGEKITSIKSFYDSSLFSSQLQL